MSSTVPGRYGILSLFMMVCIKEIFKHGRGYKFPRPSSCLKSGCGSSRIWKHGFVDAYFEGYDTALYLRRFICADCGSVYTLRPFGYWARHHVPVRIIFHKLCHRITHGIWDKSLFTRQRQCNWLRALKRNIKVYLGLSYEGEVLEGFYELLAVPIIPVIRLI
jgi:hypothetical protein